MSSGKLFVIEGACDGMGKSTQHSMLCEHLKKDGHDVITHHFPTYGTYQAMPVEKYLSGEFGSASTSNPYFANCLYAMDRAITWYSNLKKLYDEGKLFLFDRYTTSSIIYQSAVFDNIDEKKKFIDYVVDFEYHKMGIKEPDDVIFLYASFDLVTKLRNARKQNAGISNDIFERDLEYMRKVYESAMFISDYLSWTKVKCDNRDNFRTVDDIHEEVYSLVKKKI